MEILKEAFVYCWTDKLHNKLYVGVHKGNVDDGYICSSKIMLKEYKKMELWLDANPKNRKKLITMTSPHLLKHIFHSSETPDLLLHFKRNFPMPTLVRTARWLGVSS
jgi:hypothetical protein